MLFSGRVRVRVRARIRFGDRLVSGYSQVIIVLSVDIVPYPFWANPRPGTRALAVSTRESLYCLGACVDEKPD